MARQAPKKGTRPIGLIWFITVRLATTKISTERRNNNGLLAIFPLFGLVQTAWLVNSTHNLKQAHYAAFKLCTIVINSHNISGFGPKSHCFDVVHDSLATYEIYCYYTTGRHNLRSLQTILFKGNG